ncbi:MAG: CehA/McbA family metallohydrolase [Polyangiaceae bacterium]|nr:CehA/McbA family metallohydrolase [Polyangiaceae bacterium]
MTSAYRPASDVGISLQKSIPTGDLILAGDLHCHVGPPDHPLEASRDPAQTVKLAADESLDFVVLTPHVGARFFESEAERGDVLRTRDELRRALAAADTGRTLFVIGMEYTDHQFGHVGASFANLRDVYTDVSAAEAREHPARFFESFVKHGGFLVINHPLSTPLDSSISMARADLSWRPFTKEGWVSEEIAAVNKLAQGLEVYNLVVSHLRDRYLLQDTPRSLLATFARADEEMLNHRRRFVPVGGSDSHVGYLRATTFVRAKEKTETAIRDALLAGRTCVKSAQACSFELRAPGETWKPVGSDLPSTSTVEARAFGAAVEVIVNGVSVAHGEDAETLTIHLGDGCQVVRARVGEGFSAPIYVGCLSL